MNRRARKADDRPNALQFRHLWVLAFTLSLLAVGIIPLPAVENTAGRSAAELLPQLEEPLTQYRAFRRMHAKSERFDQEGWLDAWTELDERGFRFEVVQERGSDSIRNRVLKKILEREQELVEEGPARAALSDENYIFSEPDEVPPGSPYIVIKPKRKDVVLIDGRVVLSPDGSEVIRMEGKLARNPSFWTSRVNVTRHFATIEGVRVPVATQSVARVKFAGQSTLDVSYEYESINGRPISVAARRTLASASPLSR